VATSRSLTGSYWYDTHLLGGLEDGAAVDPVDRHAVPDF
jgi:hypothetical protein